MLINVLLLLIFVICLAYLAAGLRKMETDLSRSRQEQDRFQRQEREINSSVEVMKERITKEDGALSETIASLDRARVTREEANAALEAALAAPKQRLFVFDKNSLIHGKLWEVTVMSDAAEGDTAQEWAMGRVCLVGAATDRDARHRTESRFPSAQGYRIMGIERFKRAQTN